VLVVVSGTELGRTYLLDERETVIGRDPSCELILDDEGISKEHCLIRADKGYFFIEDLKSSNGTYVDGKKIKKRSLLNDFERIVLGNTILRFFMEESL